MQGDPSDLSGQSTLLTSLAVLANWNDHQTSYCNDTRHKIWIKTKRCSYQAQRDKLPGCCTAHYFTEECFDLLLINNIKSTQNTTNHTLFHFVAFHNWRNVATNAHFHTVFPQRKRMKTERAAQSPCRIFTVASRSRTTNVKCCLSNRSADRNRSKTNDVTRTTTRKKITASSPATDSQWLAHRAPLNNQNHWETKSYLSLFSSFPRWANLQHLQLTCSLRSSLYSRSCQPMVQRHLSTSRALAAKADTSEYVAQVWWGRSQGQRCSPWFCKKTRRVSRNEMHTFSRNDLNKGCLGNETMSSSRTLHSTAHQVLCARRLSTDRAILRHISQKR